MCEESANALRLGGVEEGMKLRHLLLAVLLALATTAVALPSAYAGGPTSVLLVNPNAQQARAAYVGDPVYAKLTAALG